jgi:hypothetical protein
VRVRTIAAGVTLAALAGSAVPLALSGAASAKGSGTPPTLAITKCSPAVATVGKTVTIHGTALTNATKVSIAGKNVTADITKNTATAIKISPLPGGIVSVSPNATTVKVTVSGVTATNNTSCHFKAAPKKKKHKG